jgi:hypothetical protein
MSVLLTDSDFINYHLRETLHQEVSPPNIFLSYLDLVAGTFSRAFSREQ